MDHSKSYGSSSEFGREGYIPLYDDRMIGSKFSWGIPETSATYKILHETFKQPDNPYYEEGDESSAKINKKKKKKGKGESAPYMFMSDNEYEALLLFDDYDEKWKFKKYEFTSPEEAEKCEKFLRLSRDIARNKTFTGTRLKFYFDDLNKTGGENKYRLEMYNQPSSRQIRKKELKTRGKTLSKEHGETGNEASGVASVESSDTPCETTSEASSHASVASSDTPCVTAGGPRVTCKSRYFTRYQGKPKKSVKGECCSTCKNH